MRFFCYFCCLFYSLLCAHSFVPPQDRYPQIYSADQPSNAPLPTDMTFRKLADHIIDRTTKAFNPEVVKLGDTIFLADWFIPWFVENIHPLIKHTYIIISSDTDGWNPDPFQSARTLLLDPKVGAWFSKNFIFSNHPKCFQIPIGQYIIYWGQNFNKAVDILDVKDWYWDKKELCYYNLHSESNPTRAELKKHLENQPFCRSHVDKAYLRLRQYYENIAQAKFVPCPRGYGIDTVRFWEVVLLGSIPIIKHSPLDGIYSNFPVLFVNDWTDITEDFLNKKYNELSGRPKNTDRALIPFWENKIKQVQKKIRKGNYQDSLLETAALSFEDQQEMVSIFKRLKTYKNEALIIYGGYMGVRPAQIANLFSSIQFFFVADWWGAHPGGNYKNFFSGYVKDPAILARANRITPIDSRNIIKYLKSRRFKRTHIFYDLTHKQDSIEEVFYDAESFEQNLIKFITNLKKESIIFGNMADHSYVREVLARTNKNYNINIYVKNKIWFFCK